MSGELSVFVNPSPASMSIPTVQKVIAAVFALHAITPLQKVIFSQDTNAAGDTHQFQVYTQDNRAWLDIVDGFVNGAGESPVPQLVRGSGTGSWSHPEWTAIQTLRTLIYQMHNALDEPSLIKFLFVASEIVLDAAPATASAGVGDIVATWDSPVVGHLDWIGLFLTSNPNTTYAAFYTIPDGVVTGTHNFPTPSTPGTYELRYLPANGYTSIQTSNPVTVS